MSKSPKNKKKKIFTQFSSPKWYLAYRVLWAALTLLAAVYCIYVSVNFHFTFGVAALWVGTLILFLYTLFYKQIHAFCQKGIGRVLKWGLGIGMSFLIIMLGFVAVSGYSHQSTGSEQAMIILGSGLRGEEPGALLIKRLEAAKEVWDANPTITIVVSGGKGHDEVISEAEAMRRWLVKQGVPNSSILVEDKSTSTEENLIFSKELLQQHHIEADVPISVVTNAFHCYRARQYAKMAGFSHISSVPASISLLSTPPSYFREVFAILFLWVFR